MQRRRPRPVARALTRVPRRHGLAVTGSISGGRRSLGPVEGVVLTACVACGYSPYVASGPSGAGPRQVWVETVRAPGISVDAPAEVERALAAAMTHHFGVVSSAGPDDLRLVVTVRRAAVRLAPLAEPRVRAAHYEAEVVLSAQLYDGPAVVWRGLESGRADYLSTPGGIETLDGASRRAVAQASEVAAERLVRSLVLDGFAGD